MASETGGIFVDTHILLWLASGHTKKLSTVARKAINSANILVSPMSILELHYLHEINRVPLSPSKILDKFKELLGIEVSETSFVEICKVASEISWTRDTFDRLIVADATLHKAKLVTADEKILPHYKRALW